MIDKAHLRDKAVYFKPDSFPKPLRGIVTYVENDGIWFQSDDLAAEIALLSSPADVKSPAIFVPFQHLSWLLAANE